MVEFEHDDQQHLSEQDIQNEFPDLFGCFSNEGFDPKRFNEFAEDFFKQVPVCMDRKEFNKVQSEKAKIISTLAQNLYIICTLSREQMKNITSFWKTMMSFMTPESTPFVNKIHVSYTGCVREAQRRYDCIQAKQLEMFRNCLYFSLAVDMAQFGQDHFISCIGRFGFDDRISQVVLLFDKVAEKTGDKVARFIFDRLNEKGCDFSKLVSITSDGAKNMISQDYGMANELIKLVRTNLTVDLNVGVDVHCIWCMAHRLNLVAQDFKEVPNINFVIMFVKWLTASDRLVSYSLFSRKTSSTKVKKIPPPSETRWLFLRDALKALLEQTETVEAFLKSGKNMQKWREHISSSAFPPWANQGRGLHLQESPD